MPQIFLANPFRCRMWDLHARLEHLVSEETCRLEIESFQRHGQLIPVLGRPICDDPLYDIELIAGSRRLFVARHLNVQLAVDLREISDREAIVAADIENQQRKDVSPYERGLFFARCLRSAHFKSQDDLAAELRISQSQVSRLLKLARLPSVIVNAFVDPLEIRETWGSDLSDALQDAPVRKRAIALARALAAACPRPSALDVYQQLISTSAVGRRPRQQMHDEVITDADGAPLFRIRRHATTIALLLPIDKTSAATLESICNAVRGALNQKPPPMSRAVAGGIGPAQSNTLRLYDGGGSRHAG